MSTPIIVLEPGKSSTLNSKTIKILSGLEVIRERRALMMAHTSKAIEAIMKSSSEYFEYSESESKFDSTEDQNEIKQFLADKDFDVKNIRKLARIWTRLNQEYVFCKVNQSWYCYNGKFWVECIQKPVKGLYELCDYIEDYYEKIAQIKVDISKHEEIKRIQKNGKKVCQELENSFKKCENIISSALSLPDKDLKHPISTEEMDKEIRYLPLRNCIVDLKTFNVLPHSRDYHCTRYLDYDLPFREEDFKECPRFMRFITEIFPDNDQIQDFMFRLMGYILYPGNPKEIFAFLYGTGANGKSTLTETIIHVLGKYAVTMDSVILNKNCPSKDAAHQKAQLKNKLFAAVGEDEKNELSEKRVKELSTTDPINCERKYYDPENFINTAMIFASVNDFPVIRTLNDAIRRRLLYIPFEQKFEKEKKDERLKDILKEEAEGIFHLMLVHLCHYIHNGLEIPEELMDYSKECMNDSNPFELFMESYTHGTEADSIRFNILYNKFRIFYNNNFQRSGIGVLIQKEFKELLKQKGYKLVERDPADQHYLTVRGIMENDFTTLSTLPVTEIEVNRELTSDNVTLTMIDQNQMSSRQLTI
ncbi:MAG: hypothetical protein KA886_01800 [Candidatus Cloacimonetes bacterium]|nr:hypothetical protein [Candidatus Cloacimonadota bacterium]